MGKLWAKLWKLTYNALEAIYSFRFMNKSADKSSPKEDTRNFEQSSF